MDSPTPSGFVACPGCDAKTVQACAILDCWENPSVPFDDLGEEESEEERLRATTP